MKQARCHGEQPISFGASKALKYCEIQLKYLSSGIEKVIFAVFAFILGNADEAVAAQSKLQLSINIDIQILHQELHFIGREAASKQAARCRCPAVSAKHLDALQWCCHAMEILYSCYILYGPHRGRLVFQHFIPYVRYNDDACRYWCVQIESNLLRCRIVIPTACSSLAGYAAATAEADVSPEGKQRLPGKVGVCWAGWKACRCTATRIAGRWREYIEILKYCWTVGREPLDHTLG